jgi:hypothetical protein
LMPKEMAHTTSGLSSQDFLIVVAFSSVPCPLTIDDVEKLLKVIPSI